MTNEAEKAVPSGGKESVEGVPSSVIPRREWIVPLALAGVMLLQLLTSVTRLSQTSDEANHLHAGYRYWQCRDYGYNVEHPPLAKLVAALPLRVMTVRDPFPSACGTYRGTDFQMGRQFVFSIDGDRLLMAGRAAVSLFPLAILLLAWFWTRTMFGRAAAAVTAVLIAFEPTLLAHGALITTDAAVSFGILASVAAMWFWWNKPAWSSSALLGLAVGATLTAKFSGVIVFPILLALIAVEFVTRGGTSASAAATRRMIPLAICAMCVTLAVIWWSYGFRSTPRPGVAPVRFTSDEWKPGAPRLLPIVMKTHIVPEAYVIGLGHVLLQAKTGAPTFLFGRLYANGRWFYFPAVLLVKLTLPMLILIALAIGLRWWRGHARDALYVVLPAIIFLVFAMGSRLDIGVRHVLPVIVLLSIAAGAAAASAIDARAWAKWAIVLLLVVHAGTSLRAFPNYISYANEAWGGPASAYRQVTDSNTDWGQALKLVGRRAPSSPCWVMSPYQIPLTPYGVLCRDLRVEPADRIRGTIFVSSSVLSGVLGREFDYDPGESFRGRTPAGTIGGSAFLVYEGEFDVHTNLSLVYVATAQVLLAQGRSTEALEYAQKASQLRPDAGTPHYVGCVSELAAGAPDVARHECNEALRLLNRNPDFNRRLLDAARELMKKNGLGE